MCDRRVQFSLARMAIRFAKGGGLVVLGVAAVGPVSVVQGATAAVMTLCEIARGLGMLAAFAGMQYEGYGGRRAT